MLLWNYRNHRKIVVIDDIIGYTGGMNVGIEYIGKHKKIKPWRDTHLRIYGNGVTELKKIFYIDWYYSSKEKLNNFHNTVFTNYDDSSSCNFGTNRLQLVSSGPDMNEEQVKYGYIKIITLAKKSIYIQTPYFAPDSEFLSALKVAHFSGVKVILTIPRVADKMYVYLATLSYIEELVSIGIEVHLYDGFIHSKMIIVDDCITSIGSTNIDVRSFSLSFETNAFIYDNILGSKCSKIFLYDLKNSVKLTDEHMKNKNPIMRTFQSICKLISPLF